MKIDENDIQTINNNINSYTLEQLKIIQLILNAEQNQNTNNLTDIINKKIELEELKTKKVDECSNVKEEIKRLEQKLKDLKCPN